MSRSRPRAAADRIDAARSVLITRILTAVVLVPLVLAALFLLSPRAWAVVSLAVIGLAAREWGALLGYAPGAVALFVALVLAAGAALLWGLPFDAVAAWPVRVVVAACGIATAFWLLIVPFWLHGHWVASATPVSRSAAALAGLVVLLGAWVALVSLQAQSPWRVLAAMAVVWIADTAAYFTGRSLGRHKLAPSISPGKTWEGVAGGLIAVGLYAILLASLAWPGASLPSALAAVLLAVAVAGMSVGGDLFESLLKRQAKVKDSGHLLPGHGGVLDRIDALLAAMPPLALGLAWILR